MDKGCKQQLSSDEVFSLENDRKSAATWSLFEPVWNERTRRLKKEGKSITMKTLFICIWHCCWKKWLWSYVCAVVGSVMKLFVPYIMTDIVEYLQDPDGTVWTGLMFIGGIVLATMFSSTMTFYSVYLTQALSIIVCIPIISSVMYPVLNSHFWLLFFVTC